MNTLNVDICIIGAGSGGLSVAAGAAQLGANVVLIEGGEMGGDCLNYGCVPSKAFLHAGKNGLSFEESRGHIQSVIEHIAPHDSQERFEGLGCTVLREWARFVSPDEVVAGDTRIKARRFVVAAGSSPFVPPIDGIASVPYLTNETVFELQEKPEHLLILGGGPIGMEMAQAHRMIGCDVTVIDTQEALGREDPEAAKIVKDALVAMGVTFVENAAVEHVESKNGVTITTSNGAITGSHLLVATGRKANLERLHLSDADVEANERGVVVDASLRSVSNRRVYAIGDIAGGAQFTHVAGYHAGIVVRSALFGLPAKSSTDHIPYVIYTTPELAHVGLKEDEARERYGDKLEVHEVKFDGNDRAVAMDATSGFAKVLIVKGRPVGATIVGPQAGELIATWSLMIANKVKLSALTNTVLPYPTLSEINKRVASAYFSPKLFENTFVKKLVRIVQRVLP